MFTVKTIIENVVQLQELDTAVIALSGSTQWTQVMNWLLECHNRERCYIGQPMNNMTVEEFNKMEFEPNQLPITDWARLPAYDFLEYHPAIFADAAALNPIEPEEMITGPLREPLTMVQCLGILIQECEHPNRQLPEHPYLKGCMYQLIYPGDSVYVMNSNGATIHTLR